MVSRQHARIRIEHGRALVEDLGSRNGVSVNGRPIAGWHELHDADRLRIGTQEVVFCVLAETPRRAPAYGSRPTGFMCHCAGCGLAYPIELVECPSCGSRDRSNEETISGVIGSDAQRNWPLELLLELVRKAHGLGRWDDVERSLRRARGNIDELNATGHLLSEEHLQIVVGAAAQLAGLRKSSEWAAWCLALCSVHGIVPPAPVASALLALPSPERRLLAEPARRLLEDLSARGGPRAEEQANFDSLQRAVARE